MCMQIAYWSLKTFCNTQTRAVVEHLYERYKNIWFMYDVMIIYGFDFGHLKYIVAEITRKLIRDWLCM